jgi:hypothetical protein
MPNVLTLMVAALVTTSAAAQKQLPPSSDSTSSSSGKSAAGALSAVGTALQQAAALGYTVNTFHTGLWNATKVVDVPRLRHQRGANAGPWNAPKAIDWQNTGAIGFQWYLNKALGGKPTPPSRLTVNRDGSLTLNGGEINAFSAPTSHGMGFGGGACFEATFSFDPQSVVGNYQKTWPAWWAMSLEHFLNLPAQHWTGQPSNVMHFAEMDFFEYDTWNWAGQNTYGGATHDWGGSYESKKGWQYNYYNDTFVIWLSVMTSEVQTTF